MPSVYRVNVCVCENSLISLQRTVKPFLSGLSKIEKKTKVLKTKGSLVKVESTAECSFGAFCNAFDLH